MRGLLVAIVFSIILISAPLNVSLGQNSSPEGESKDILITSDMQINLVVVGDNWTTEDKQAISSQLIKSYEPMILAENKPLGVEYNYNYNFVSASTTFSSGLFSFIDSVAVEVAMPEPIAQWVTFEHPEFGQLKNISYKVIDAIKVENWLADNWSFEKGYTVFFFALPESKLNYLHTYGMTTTDPDTGVEFKQEGMMGFGGSDRFYFIDLAAGPWVYPSEPLFCDDVAETPLCNQVNPITNKNMYDITSQEEIQHLISEYVNNAVTLLFTPSYQYSPYYRINHEISIFVIDFTAGRSFYDSASKYVNKDLIDQSFNNLIPYAQWTTGVLSLKFDDLPRDLQDAMLKGIQFTPIEGSGVTIVKSAELINELHKWAADQLTEQESNELRAMAETTVFIPVFIFVFDSEAYVDEFGIGGLAAPDPTNPAIPCCVIIATDQRDASIFGSGLSVVTMHETAHVLGLTHPHDGYRPDRGDFVDWFYDWSYTPMTYGAPDVNGCGLADELCGMIISKFGQFNVDAIDRGLILSLLNEAQLNVYNARLLLGDVDHDSPTLSSTVKSSLNSIDSDVQSTKQHFNAMNYFNHKTFQDTSNVMNPMDDAFDFALRAFKTSEQLIKDVNTLAKPPITAEPAKEKLDISVRMKQTKKVTLVSIKNNDEVPLFGLRLKIDNGSINFVKARGWDRDRIDQSTVMVSTNDRPISNGKSLIIILLTDNQNASFEWSAYGKAGHAIGSGVASIKLPEQVSLKM